MTLQLKKICVNYGELAAVKDISLTVATGEIVALLGGSGSGKSSLLRAVLGLEPLAAGEIFWDTEALDLLPVHQRGIGMMFQDGQLFEHYNVAGNIAYGLRGASWRDKAKRAVRVAELLQLVGLAGFQDRRVSQLSGGQQQRVALARSLAPAPRVLLLDEPLSALDRGLREHLVAELRQLLKATNTTALYVTHDQDEAFAVADRVAVLADGELLQVDPPRQLWRQPKSVAVAEFLGYGPFLATRILPLIPEVDFSGADGTIAEKLWASDPALAGSDAFAKEAATANDPVWTASHTSTKEVGEIGATLAKNDSAFWQGHLIGIGPQGLVPCRTGVLVSVLAVQYQRGYVEVTVELPDGQQARVLLPEAPSSELRVALDPAACVRIPISA